MAWEALAIHTTVCSLSLIHREFHFLLGQMCTQTMSSFINTLLAAAATLIFTIAANNAQLALILQTLDCFAIFSDQNYHPIDISSETRVGPHSFDLHKEQKDRCLSRAASSKQGWSVISSSAEPPQITLLDAIGRMIKIS